MVTASSGGLGFLESAGPTLVWIVVIGFVFLECAVIVGLFLPGDSMLLTAGVVMAGHHAGEEQIWALAGGAMVAAVAGNQVGYVIGQRTGTGFVERRDGRYVNAANLHRVSRLLDRYGFWAVLLARWIPWVRTLCPLVAGAARMDHRRYTVASTLGAIAWAPVLLLIGFYAGSHLKGIPWLMHGVTAALVIGVVIGTAFGIKHYRQEMGRPSRAAARADEFDPPTVVLPRCGPDAERSR